MALLTTILCLGLSQILWAGDDRSGPTGKRTMSEGLFFSSITLSNNSIMATMPLTASRYLSFLNGTNYGFADPRQVFILKSGDELELTEKHHRITATPLVTESNAELRVLQVFDARSLGGSSETNEGRIKLK